ncbi:hypothetical protein [Candidatus Nitrosocosmicus sp. T]
MMAEKCGPDETYPSPYLYTPGKCKIVSYRDNVISNSPLEKNTAGMTPCNNDDDKLCKPINLFSTDMSKIDFELKNMHRRWSNID